MTQTQSLRRLQVEVEAVHLRVLEVRPARRRDAERVPLAARPPLLVALRVQVGDLVDKVDARELDAEHERGLV